MLSILLFSVMTLNAGDLQLTSQSIFDNAYPQIESKLPVALPVEIGHEISGIRLVGVGNEKENQERYYRVVDQGKLAIDALGKGLFEGAAAGGVGAGMAGFAAFDLLTKAALLASGAILPLVLAIAAAAFVAILAAFLFGYYQWAKSIPDRFSVTQSHQHDGLSILGPLLLTAIILRRLKAL